jgi:general nucleoside transport system permease protein
MLRIERKAESKFLRQRIVSVFIALAVAGIVIGICGYNPFVVYKEMLVGSFGSVYYVQKTIQKIIPLLIMGLGVAVCFKMNFINIGAEGQFYMGAVAATYVALNFGGLPSALTLLLMFAAAFLVGGLWCLIAGFLKSKWGVSETLVTLMLNYIAIKLVSYLQYVLWKDPKSVGFPKIANYPVDLQLKSVFGIHAGWIIAIVLTVFVWFLLHRSKLGYEISVMGANERTARYAGMSTTKILLLTSLIGGGICGIAGLIQASGVEHTLNDQMANGMGYTAIAIAYMAQMEPPAILIVSFLFSILLQGGAYMQISMQIPSATGDVIQGIILLFILGSEFFSRYRVVREHKQKEEAI